jgi:uncharacterized lipoprotein YajG
MISNTLTMTPRTETSGILKYMNRPQRLTILAVFFAVAMLSGCTPSANLNIVNRSTAELTNVVATGSGFTTQSIGSIPAGAQRSVSLSVSSESALKLDFDANGKHFTSDPQGYFEGGSGTTKVTAIVSPDFTVTVDTK